MPNDKFECTFKGVCVRLWCVQERSNGFAVCEYLKISSDVDDEKRG